jgi:hypothetical protein
VGVGGAGDPEVARGAAVEGVEVQGGAGVADLGGDVEAVFSGERLVVFPAVVVEGEEVVVDVAAGEGELGGLRFGGAGFCASCAEARY